MALDSVEQERIDMIRIWWRQNKKIVLSLSILSLLVLFSWYGWLYFDRGQKVQGGVIYEQFDALLNGKEGVIADTVQAKSKFELLQKNYSSQTYTWLAGFNLANKLIESGDKVEGQKILDYLMTEADSPYRWLAGLSLMSLYLEEKKYSEALQIADADIPTEFIALFEDRKGDILLAQNKKSEARAAYEKALEKIESEDSIKEIITLKLSTL